MKKYLFLLFLFIVYLLLIFRNDISSKQVISYDDEHKNSICDITLEFDGGISSKDINELFDNYNDQYYIYNIGLNNKEIKLSCTEIVNCLKNVFEQEDNIFSMLNIYNGFKINKIDLIADKKEIIKYLNENDVVYKIK